MAETRALTEVNLMDTFTRIIPGAVFLAGIVVTMNVEETGLGSATVADLALGGVLAFVIGMVLQGVGQAFEFQIRKDQWFSARLERLGDDIADGNATYFQRKFWHACNRDFFSLPDVQEMGSKEYGQLYRLLLTYLETTPYSRANRMQAIYQMCLGLSAAFGLLVLYYLGSLYLLWLFGNESTAWLLEATVFEDHTVLILFASAGLSALSLGFYALMRSFKDYHFEYLVLEFYLDRTHGGDGDGGKDRRVQG